MEEVDEVVFDSWIADSEVLEIGLDLSHRSFDDRFVLLFAVGLTPQQNREHSDGKSHVRFQGQRIELNALQVELGGCHQISVLQVEIGQIIDGDGILR